MVTLIAVANETNIDWDREGDDNHYLVKGETVESARSRFYDMCDEHWYNFEYEVTDTDITDYLRTDFSADFNAKVGEEPTKEELEFINSDETGLTGCLDISEEMYDFLLDYILLHN